MFAATLVSAQAPTSVAPIPAHGAVIDKYCMGCHNDKTKTAGLSLADVDITHPGAKIGTLEKVVLKLRSGMMPPAGMPRPDAATVNSFVTSLEDSIDKEAAARPNPGRPILHRLNQTEFANSIRELLDLKIDPAAFLPEDDMSQGYNNMSDVLTISPTLHEGYVRAAGKISRLAVGDRTAAPAVDTYVVPQAISQTKHVDGTPFGTRGGIVVHHNFPADGEYVFRLSFYYSSIGPVFGDNKPSEGSQVEIAVNGERVALMNFDGKMKVSDIVKTPPIRIKSGPQTVTASFIEKFSGPVQDFVQPFQQSLADLSTGHINGLTGLPHLRNLGIDGPYNITGVSETPSRNKVFTCRPATTKDELACANKIISALARLAFRRPVTEVDLRTLMVSYQSGRSKGDFDAGIRLALQAILADPEFIFRFERTPANVTAGSNYRISDLELASRLSFFLWSSPPDDALITVASQNKLKDPVVLEQQVKRMLADPRSEALSTNFASHWLQLQNLDDVHPDVFLFPDWDRNLTNSMRRETEIFFDNLVHEDRSIKELLTANYSFVDERLARHYGIPNVIGNRFRRVDITDENRRGLLGQGSILTLTSMSTRTSPVVRGKWILDVLLGTPPPLPPANVPPLKEANTTKDTIAAEKLPSVRERLEAHRANAACASCHRIMDPIGFSLENFNAVGAWRTKDNGDPIDPSGTLVDGTKINSPATLREALMKSDTLFVRNFSRNLLMYSLGRILQDYDYPAVRAVAKEAARNDNRFSSFVMAIVKSTPFQMRRADETGTVKTDAARNQKN
jgi:cytochrome c551/c552